MAQADLDTLQEWFQYNLLTINASKTSYVLFSAKNKRIDSQLLTLNIKGIALKQSSEEKYLGLTIDKNLTWKAHLLLLQNKLSSLMGSLYNMAHCIPQKVRLLIYNSLVKPHLLYLIEIWGSAAKTNLQKLQVVQNRIIKILYNYDYLTPTEKVFNETKLLNISQLYTYTTCILIYKITHNMIHSQLTFTTKGTSSRYSCRRANHLVLPNVRTNYGKYSITFAGAQLFNKLPTEIKDANTLGIFKRKLFDHLIKQAQRL